MVSIMQTTLAVAMPRSDAIPATLKSKHRQKAVNPFPLAAAPISMRCLIVVMFELRQCLRSSVYRRPPTSSPGKKKSAKKSQYSYGGNVPLTTNI